MITFPKKMNQVFSRFCAIRAELSFLLTLFLKEFEIKILRTYLFLESCNLVSFVIQKGMQ
jgi:hypothetical protein